MTTLSFDDNYILRHLMGPNAVIMTEELCRDFNPPKDLLLCDLGCGTGLSSLYLAQHTGCKIVAVDLWINAEENQQRFKDLGFGEQIMAVNAEAPDLPFPENFFDGLISVDSYHYFGRESGIIDRIAYYVKPGCPLYLAIPGLIRRLDDDMMEVFSTSWTREDMESIREIDFWKELLAQSDSVEVVSIYEMTCFEQAWSDWFASGNEYAISDQAVMDNGGSELMNLIAIELTVL